MLTPFELTLLFIISGLLLLCAWLSYHHERAMEELRRHWAPLPLASELLEQPFELRRPSVCPPRFAGFTREELEQMERRNGYVRPPFENYGVDISVAPTIGIADTPGRLPSFTLREFGGA
jgi:hypothetical protein